MELNSQHSLASTNRSCDQDLQAAMMTGRDSQMSPLIYAVFEMFFRTRKHDA